MKDFNFDFCMQVLALEDLASAAGGIDIVVLPPSQPSIEIAHDPHVLGIFWAQQAASFIVPVNSSF